MTNPVALGGVIHVCMYVMWVGIPVVYRAILPTFVRWPMLPPGVPRYL